MSFEKFSRNIIDLIPNGIKKNKFYEKIKEWYYHKSSDIYLISFPKCGRTWLRLMIGKTIQQYFNLEIKERKDLLELRRLSMYNSKIPKIRVTHDDDPQWKNPDQIETCKLKYKNKKIIFLVRDPRDVIVSSYFQKKKREGGFNKEISDYIYSKKGSIDSIIKFYNIWINNRDIPKDFLLIRYEDMHENTSRELQKTLNFIGLKKINSKIVSKAVKFASFDNMRKMEKKNEFNSNRLKPGNKNDKESYKTRKGKVGGYTDYLDKTEIKYIDNKIKNNLSDFFNY